MLNRSHLPLSYDYKELSEESPVVLMSYTQRFQRSHSLHYHNVLELGICLNGSGVQFINKEIYPFSANTVSVIQKGCIHDSHIIIPTPKTPPSQWLYIFINLDAMGIQSDVRQSFNVYDIELAMLFKMMAKEMEMQPTQQNVFAMLLRVFLIKAKRIEPRIHPLKRSSRSDVVAEVINYIAQKYQTKLSVESLAGVFNMSISGFSKMIKHHLGMSPQQYIIHVRLSMAEHLLRTSDRSILSISEDVGFQTLSSFNRLFKKKYGVPPRAMR